MTKNLYGSVPRASAFGSDESSDDEDSPLAHQIDGEGGMPSQKWQLRITRIIKFLSYPVVFLIVLSGSVIAKGTILLMTSQIRKNRTVLYCNRLLHSDKTFMVTVPEEEKIAWIWCIIFAFAGPEVFTLIHSATICLFESPELPKREYFLLVAVMETLHVIGLAIMFIRVLPGLDVIQGAMLTSCVCFVPGVLGLLSRNKKHDESKRFIFVLVDIIALAAQATAFAIWPFLNNSDPSLWLIPVALILVSCGWWENYVSVQSPLSLIRSLGRISEQMRSTKNFTYVLVSPWKIATFLLTSILILHLENNTGFWYLFTMFESGFSEHNVSVTEIQSTIGGETIPNLTDVIPNGLRVIMTTDFTTPIYVLVIQISSAYLAYVFGKFACKTLIQGFSYALPINITIPVLISLLIATCDLRNVDPCFFHGIIPDYLFYESPSLSVLSDFIVKESTWIWLIWLLSQTWITLHIFTPKCQRPESTESLFGMPYYDGLLIDQSMAMNRKRDDLPSEDSRKRMKETYDGEDEVVPEEPRRSGIPESDSVTKIYACATMWHENKGEMTECLKSILRLDKNQCAIRNYQECLQITSPDYYELESHIFIDDAFAESKHNKQEVEVNEWVKQFVKLVDETTFRETRILVKPLKKYPTPYGGRLVWTLPGNTKLFVHLKDSSKIRQRKRWSQVMYMYYLLRHRIKDMMICKDRKKAIAENTFILALDGDIVFQPSAVKLLIDLMKKDKNLGAACGRIHPLGSGPLVWYQMFEYAIGHWLQKATEHMIGCVLCSPGCFSLFRAKALMKTDVMKTYTTKSSEARHYVQYDQGEDRWLCTLLLKRGYRVEYSAASDAYTHAPEGFIEFFNQRRRWLPSTMANTMDLIVDYKRVVTRNKNVSRLYMLYQLLLTAGTILGPGTMFLMLIGAFTTAFNIDIWDGLCYNIIPVFVFIVVCFTCDSKIQLFVAAIVSMIYGLVMMTVIVGIFLQIFEDSWLAPSSMFLFLAIGQIVITGIFHPQELECLPYGIIYFLSIPTMYMLLMIYSIANLNDVTWGTRVGNSNQTSEKSDQEKKKRPEESERKAKRTSVLGLNKNEQGSIEFSLAGLFKCIFCTHDRTSDEKHHLSAIAKSLELMEKRFDNMERSMDAEGYVSGRSCASFTMHQTVQGPAKPADSDSESSEGLNSVQGNRERAFLVNPYWLEDEDLKRGEVDFLSAREEQFWEDIIGKYLEPIYEDEEKEKKVAASLKELRDKSFVTFLMLNALFVTIVFLMQLHQDMLNIKWPLGFKIHILFDHRSREVHIAKGYLRLEPIGLAFVVFFGIILIIQFTAMLFHRLCTFEHILASTSLQDWGYCWKRPGNASRKGFLIEVTDEIVEELERSANVETRQGRNLSDPSNSHNGENHTLDDVFRQRIFSMSEGWGLPRHVSARKSVRIFHALQRNESIAAQRRLSQSQSNGSNNSQPVPSTSTLNTIRESSESRPSGFVNYAFEIAESRTSVT